MYDTMFPTATTRSEHRYISALDDQLCEHGWEEISTLVIAHDDPLLIGRLGEAVAAPAAVLSLTQSAWNFDDSSLAAAVVWAVDEAKADTLILAGHSQGLTSTEAARQFFARAQNSPTSLKQNKAKGLCRRVAQAQDSLQRTKALFAMHFERLHAISAVARQTLQRQLHVMGLFYLAENGLFLAYEPESQVFRPLFDPQDEHFVFPCHASDT